MAGPREADLLEAARHGDVSRLENLLPAAGDVEDPGDSDGVTPLMLAASGGHEAAVELLLERGFDPSRRDAQGRSAAAHARMAGHDHLATRLDGVVDQERKIR